MTLRRWTALFAGITIVLIGVAWLVLELAPSKPRTTRYPAFAGGYIRESDLTLLTVAAREHVAEEYITRWDLRSGECLGTTLIGNIENSSYENVDVFPSPDGSRFVVASNNILLGTIADDGQIDVQTAPYPVPQALTYAGCWPSARTFVAKMESATENVQSLEFIDIDAFDTGPTRILELNDCVDLVPIDSHRVMAFVKQEIGMLRHTGFVHWIDIDQSVITKSDEWESFGDAVSLNLSKGQNPKFLLSGFDWVGLFAGPSEPELWKWSRESVDQILRRACVSDNGQFVALVVENAPVTQMPSRLKITSREVLLFDAGKQSLEWRIDLPFDTNLPAVMSSREAHHLIVWMRALLTFANNGKWIVVASADGRVVVLETDSGHEVSSFRIDAELASGF